MTRDDTYADAIDAIAHDSEILKSEGTYDRPSRSRFCWFVSAPEAFAASEAGADSSAPIDLEAGCSDIGLAGTRESASVPVLATILRTGQGWFSWYLEGEDLLQGNQSYRGGSLMSIEKKTKWSLA